MHDYQNLYVIINIAVSKFFSQIQVLKIGKFWILEDFNYQIITLCIGTTLIEIRLNEIPTCMY